jgi:hypothetical protein
VSWQEVALAALNVFQAIALAWITLQDRRVRSELQAYNGEQASAIRSLRAALAEQSAAVRASSSR